MRIEIELLRLAIPVPDREQSMSNEMRAVRATSAVRAWAASDGSLSPAERNDVLAQAPKHAVYLLLSDLRHLCEAQGLDYAELDAIAQHEFELTKRGDEDQTAIDRPKA